MALSSARPGLAYTDRVETPVGDATVVGRIFDVKTTHMCHCVGLSSKSKSRWMYVKAYDCFWSRVSVL
jgi:hypothetical protein